MKPSISSVLIPLFTIIAIIILNMSSTFGHLNVMNFENSSSLPSFEEVVLSRKKRFLQFNVDAQAHVGFLLSIPITIVLPVMSNLFNTRRYARSLAYLNPPDEIPSFEDDPIVQESLDRVSSYFELLHISEHSCQKRAICEFSANEDLYYPISELILNRIRDPMMPAITEYNEELRNSTYMSLYKVYSKALDTGLGYGERKCEKDYAEKCPISISERLNMPVLKYWNLISSMLKFNIKDNFKGY